MMSSIIVCQQLVVVYTAMLVCRAACKRPRARGRTRTPWSSIRNHNGISLSFPWFPVVSRGLPWFPGGVGNGGGEGEKCNEEFSEVIIYSGLSKTQKESLNLLSKLVDLLGKQLLVAGFLAVQLSNVSPFCLCERQETWMTLSVGVDAFQHVRLEAFGKAFCVVRILEVAKEANEQVSAVPVALSD